MSKGSMEGNEGTPTALDQVMTSGLLDTGDIVLFNRYTNYTCANDSLME